MGNSGFLSPNIAVHRATAVLMNFHSSLRNESSAQSFRVIDSFMKYARYFDEFAAVRLQIGFATISFIWWIWMWSVAWPYGSISHWSEAFEIPSRRRRRSFIRRAQIEWNKKKTQKDAKNVNSRAHFFCPRDYGRRRLATTVYHRQSWRAAGQRSVRHASFVNRTPFARNTNNKMI